MRALSGPFALAENRHTPAVGVNAVDIDLVRTDHPVDVDQALVAALRRNLIGRQLVATDEGARRLGEVALVPHSSPISHSGLLFFNTLFDENAACHIALGQCYSKCFIDGTKLTPQQIAAQGGNQSLIHIDWMIGSGKTDIDGVYADGRRVPVFRKGEWA